MKSAGYSSVAFYSGAHNWLNCCTVPESGDYNITRRLHVIQLTRLNPSRISSRCAAPEDEKHGRSCLRWGDTIFFYS